MEYSGPSLQIPSLPSTPDVWAKDRTTVWTQQDYSGHNIISENSGTVQNLGSQGETGRDDLQWLDSLLEKDPLPSSSGPSQQLEDGEDVGLHSLLGVDLSSPIAPAEEQFGEGSRRARSEAPAEGADGGKEVEDYQGLVRLLEGTGGVEEKQSGSGEDCMPNAPDLASPPAPPLGELGREEVGSLEEKQVDKEPEKEGPVEDFRTEVVKETKRKQSRPWRKNGSGEDWGPDAPEEAKEKKRARSRRYYLNKRYRAAQKAGVEYVPRIGRRERDQKKIEELEEKCRKEENMRKQEKKEKMIEKRKRKKVEEELKEERDQTKIRVRRLENIVMAMAGRKGRDGVYSEEIGKGDELPVIPVSNRRQWFRKDPGAR